MMDVRGSNGGPSKTEGRELDDRPGFQGTESGSGLNVLSKEFDASRSLRKVRSAPDLNVSRERGDAASSLRKVRSGSDLKVLQMEVDTEPSLPRTEFASRVKRLRMEIYTRQHLQGMGSTSGLNVPRERGDAEPSLLRTGSAPELNVPQEGGDARRSLLRAESAPVSDVLRMGFNGRLSLPRAECASELEVFSRESNTGHSLRSERTVAESDGLYERPASRSGLFRRVDGAISVVSLRGRESDVNIREVPAEGGVLGAKGERGTKVEVLEVVTPTDNKPLYAEFSGPGGDVEEGLDRSAGAPDRSRTTAMRGRFVNYWLTPKYKAEGPFEEPPINSDLAVRNYLSTASYYLRRCEKEVVRPMLTTRAGDTVAVATGVATINSIYSSIVAKRVVTDGVIDNFVAGLAANKVLDMATEHFGGVVKPYPILLQAATGQAVASFMHLAVNAVINAAKK